MPNRPLLFQPVVTFGVDVGITPTPVKINGNVNEIINSFAISVPFAAANNVFFGDSNVTINTGVAGTAGTGIEIVAGGGPLQFLIIDERQQYETMYPSLQTGEILGCRDMQPFEVPLVVWDMSQLYLVAVAATRVSVVTFKMQWT